MATKKQIAEQAMRILEGGHLKPDNPVDIREIMLVVDQVRDRMCKDSVENNVKAGRYEVDEDFLSIDASLTPVLDAVSGFYSVDLTYELVLLPKGLSVYQVSPDGDHSTAYPIITVGHLSLLKGSSAVNNDQNIYVWNMNGKLYFSSNPSGTVDAYVVISGKEIVESADYPIPPDMEAELLKEVVQIFSVQDQQPHDEAEDGIKQ
jgi:hypothetical protein